MQRDESNYSIAVQQDIAPAFDAARLVDIAGSAMLLLFLSPLLVLAALLVMLADAASPFAAEPRLGRGGRTFLCWKFRVHCAKMSPKAASLPLRAAFPADTLATTRELTPLGRLLRQSSIEQLPQLFNILSGEMSFVGPCPLAAGESARYGRHLEVYGQVRPGIVCLWRLEGGKTLPFEQRIALDAAYVRRRSWKLDIAIIFRSFLRILGVTL